MMVSKLSESCSKSLEKGCHVVVLWYPTHNLFKGSVLIVFAKKTCKTVNSCAVIEQVKVLGSDSGAKLLIWLDPDLAS